MSRPAIFHSSKTFVGLALLSFGTLILHDRFFSALSSLQHMLAATRTGNLVPAVVLTALQTAETGRGADQHLVRTLLQHAFLMFQPLLMVVAGTLLSRPAVTCRLGMFSKKDF